MGDFELIKNETKEQIYMEHLYRRIWFDFESFNLPVTTSKSEFTRLAIPNI